MGEEASLGEGGERASAEQCRLFVFRAEEVLVHRPAGRKESDYSELDWLLLSTCCRASREGALRYDLADVVTRKVPGRYGIVAMNNPKRLSHRRTPADMQSLLQPFDHNQFNFNRVKRKEVLFEVERKSERGVEKRHMVIVNVSPIDRGHVLLVPDPTSCLPQVMTQDSLQLCLELVALSGHSEFCMVANSLLAFASVNHLHYHFMYTSPHLLAAKIGGRRLYDGCFELTDHYARGFGFSLDSTPLECSRLIFSVVSVLLEEGVPFNIVTLRGAPFSLDGASHTSLPPHTDTVIRTLLIPRKPVLGFKIYEQEDGPLPPFFSAACELGLGLIPMYDMGKFHSFSEEDFLSILREWILPEEEFMSLQEKVTSRLLQTNSIP